jgi:hypothetical protein
MEMVERQVSNRGDDIFSRTGNIYTAIAIVALNAAVLLGVINGLLYGVFYLRDSVGVAQHPKRPKDDGRFFNSDGSPVDNGKRSEYALRWFDYGAYGNVPEEYVAELLDDFDDLSHVGSIYQPWVGFSEPSFSGKHVHVDRDIRGYSIRRTMNSRNSSNRPVIKIFVFGGSTTFGYHLSDEHTWPNYLAQILDETAAVDVQITNYGHGYFTPSQEAILFADLLKSGHRPSLALFMDGINIPEPIDVPPFSKETAEAVRRLQFPPSYSEQFEWIPIVRLANFFERRLMGGVVTADTGVKVDTKTHMETAINSFRQSRNIAKAVGALYDVPTLFFLQPNPLYNYDSRLFRDQYWQARRAEHAILTKGIYEAVKTDPAYVDLSGLFADWGNRKAFVDDSHYTPSFNNFLAHRVANFIDVNRLEPRDMGEPTGGVRTQ